MTRDERALLEATLLDALEPLASLWTELPFVRGVGIGRKFDMPNRERDYVVKVFVETMADKPLDLDFSFPSTINLRWNDNVWTDMPVVLERVPPCPVVPEGRDE